MGAIFKHYLVVSYCPRCGPLYRRTSFFDRGADVTDPENCPKCGSPLEAPLDTYTDSYYQARLLGFRVKGQSRLETALILVPQWLFGLFGLGLLLFLIVKITTHTIAGGSEAVKVVYGEGGMLQTIGGPWLAAAGLLLSAYFGARVLMFIIQQINRSRNQKRKQIEAEQKAREEHHSQAEESLREHYEKKIDLYKKIYALTKELRCSEDSEKHLARGTLFLSIGEFREAIEDFTTVLDARPQYTEALERRADAYAELGNNQHAIEDLEQIMSFRGGGYQVFKKLARRYCDRAGDYFDAGEYEKAVEDYTKAIELNQEDRSIYWHRGLALSKLGKDKEANDDFGKWPVK